MNEPWSAEYAVSEALVEKLIESQFPELDPVEIEKVGQGWDNTVYRVNKEYIFRFPRRQLAAELLESENKLLPFISSRLPLEIPNPLFNGVPNEEFIWPFLGYREIQGRTACAASLDNEQRTKLAQPLAQFLKSLHSISLKELVQLGAREDEIGRLDLNKRLPKAHENLIKIKKLGLLSDISPFQRILKEAESIRSQEYLSLAHGDLYVRHLLVDHECELAGIIDWGDIHLGNPAVDLAIAHSFLPKAAHEVFRETYGVIDDDAWLLARMRALYHTIILLLYAHDVSDSDLLRECHRSLIYIHEGT